MRVYGAICDVKRFIANNAGHIVFCAILCVFSVGIAVAAGVKLDCPSDYFEQEGGILIVWVVIASACGIKSVFLIVIDAVFLLAELAIVSSCAVYVSRCDQRLRDGISCVDDLSRTVLIMFAFYVCTLCLETVVLSALIAVIF